MKVLNKRLVFLSLIASIFVISIFLRLIAFDQEGGDHRTFKKAVSEFLEGTNPYEYTVLSYQREDLKHGYAYMPTLLYIQTSLTQINKIFNLDQPTKYLWKIPVLLADIGIGIIIHNILRKKNYSNSIIIMGLLFWFFNPYFLMRYEYTNYEALPMFFLLLSLIVVGKKDFLSGVLFALAVTLKTFPIILLSILILKSKKVKLFLLGGIITGILISLPFFRSTNDFSLFVNGSFLVHGGRGIQGRPFFSFLTYYLQNYGISFYQSEFSKTYTLLALLGSQLLPLYLYFKKKVTNIWILVLSSFFVYYLFTPVLNRTHLIWGMPFAYLGILNIYKNRLKKYYLILISYYIFACFYYFLWNKGLKNPTSFGGQIWIDPVFDNRHKFPLINELYVKAVHWKKELFN